MCGMLRNMTRIVVPVEMEVNKRISACANTTSSSSNAWFTILQLKSVPLGNLQHIHDVPRQANQCEPVFLPFPASHRPTLFGCLVSSL
jgi:hypothetical protein